MFVFWFLYLFSCCVDCVLVVCVRVLVLSSFVCVWCLSLCRCLGSCSTLCNCFVTVGVLCLF